MKTASFPCFVCGGRRHKAFFSAAGCDFWRCRECGVVRMRPLPEPAGAGEDYQGFDLATYRRFMEAFRVPQYERDIARMRAHGATGRLLDIGCGMGEFLDVAERSGFSVAGVEPSPTASEIASKRHPVLRGEFLDLDLGDRRFGAVTLWSVLEHVHAPADVLARIAALTERGGILALRAPDVRGLLPRLALALHRGTFGRISGPLRVLYQLDWHYKHFTGFDRRTLVRAVENAGYTVLSVRREMSYSQKSLSLRMDSIPLGRGAGEAVVRAGLGVVGLASRLVGGEDERILIARKK
jgi:2-polyprenyl-3-methyl-5-hydroxy-6-metoxy-1,4-benzoquinol methylase